MELQVMRVRDDGTDLLLELLVDGIAGVFDGDAFHVAGGDFETEGEVEVDFLDRGVAEELVEDVFLFDGCGGAVDFPGRGGQFSGTTRIDSGSPDTGYARLHRAFTRGGGSGLLTSSASGSLARS